MTGNTGRKIETCYLVKIVSHCLKVYYSSDQIFVLFCALRSLYFVIKLQNG
ncbi:hypothetical protein HMPREF0201_01071 [Cedecea davisae DSM 4568]|uniref:Uncharacterized protein n=1 Tax=Cedecea davisae DSM 4568 TaxID=566551 RepID=S3IZT9_9ENTR|nr:hypothetical protein HMPREF0201_01071 [Cedecea davisae DSM 4568]